MPSPFDQFRSNMDRVDNLTAIHEILRSQTTTALDITDILRAAFVLAVSAFDFYVHETVGARMLDTQRGKRPATAAFRKFRISMESLQAALASPLTDDGWLDEEIRSQHGWKSFQHPD